MLLKNNRGQERNFKLLMKIEKDDKIYLIYKDKITGKLYGGIKKEEKLSCLQDSEIELLNNIIERINGEV